MAATRRRVRAAALVVAGVIVLAGCTSEQTLAPDPAGAEPGYPQYTPPATSPDGVSSGGTPDPVETPDEPEVPGGSPSATPTAEPSLTPTADPSATPAPSAEPEPAAPPTTTPSSPAPTTPPTSASPTTPVPTTPAPTTLQTQTWQPRCGAALTAPAVVNDVSVAVTLPAVPSGELLATDAVLTNGSTSPLTGEVYVASVTVARDGVVVSTWVEGGDSVEPISIAARGTLVVPVDHDLVESCGAPGTVTPEPPPAAVSTAAPKSGATDGVQPPPPSEGQATGGTAATGSVASGSLPPASYTAVVAIHVLRDGGMGSSVVAASGVIPLTISDPR